MTTDTATLLLISFALAAALYAFYTHFHRALLGAGVRALLELGANSPERAKTVGELELSDPVVFLRALRRGTSLTNLVTVEGVIPERLSRESAGDCRARFYIPPEREEKARALYGAGESILMPILVTLTAAILAGLVSALLPLLFTLGA